MQTFLPYADFVRSAEVLDVPRLGKQRVETLQILRALELFDYGWSTHPAVRMWQGHTPALVRYGLDVVDVWTRGDRADSTAAQILEFAPWVVGRSQADLADDGLMPPWLGDDRLHLSHRSALVRKAPDRYRDAFGDVDVDLPYFWPDPPASPTVLDTTDPHRWVVRAVSPEQFDLFTDERIIGLDTASGIDVDASAGHVDDLRVLLKERGPGRRPTKALRVLASFVTDIDVGDEVVVPVPGEPHLLRGVVTGAYRFVASSDLAPHRRSVRWTGVVDRAEVDPPALLQNPRMLFPIPAGRR